MCVCVREHDGRERKKARYAACMQEEAAFRAGVWRVRVGRVWVCVLNLVAVAERCVARAESRVER